MLLVGLTGGIGSGKSTVAEMLARRGAVVFDADVLAREAVEPGTPGYEQVLARFGDGILLADGSIDRAALAALVFEDPGARRDLERIVHPEVQRLFLEGIRPHAGSDRVVVFDAPLLVETGRHAAFDSLIVVVAKPETQVQRLASDRSMSEEDVRARMEAQLPVEEKAGAAEFILDNEGSVQELEAQVDRLWPELQRRAAARAHRAERDRGGR